MCVCVHVCECMCVCVCVCVCACMCVCVWLRTVLPLSCCRVDEAKEFIRRHGLWVEVHPHGLLLHHLVRLVQGPQDLTGGGKERKGHGITESTHTQCHTHPVPHTPSATHPQCHTHPVPHTPSATYTQCHIHPVPHTPSATHTQCHIHHTYCTYIQYLLGWTPWLQLFSGPERCGVYLRADTIRGQPLNRVRRLFEQIPWLLYTRTCVEHTCIERTCIRKSIRL